MRRRFSGRCIRLLLPLVAWALAPVVSAWAQPQKQVLVLYSTRRDAQIVAIGERELPRILEKGLGRLDYYSEYIDEARFPDPAYQEAFRNFLSLKYKSVRFDAVIAVQDSALELVSHARNELFPGTPIVFFATSPVTRRIENATGLVAGFNFSDTLAFIAELQPQVRQVFVITGAAPADQEYERLAREQFRSVKSGIPITYLSGLPTRELESRVASLPANSAIYYLLVNRDGDGQNVHPLDYLESLAAVANAPMYCWVDSAMERGIVGGNLKDQKVQLEAVGQLALRVLSGEPPSSIPVSSPNLNVRQVDWRQLRRWSIGESRVPPGTRVLFKEPSVWDRYRIYIIGAGAVVLAQTLLIAGLLVQRRQRRQAEEHLRGSEEALRNSYTRIRDLGSRLLQAQDTERSRIARELHDDISQQVALLSIDLELLSRAVPADTGPQAGEALTRAQEIARSVRDLSHRLHPAKLQLIGLVAALQALQRELSRAEPAIIFTHEQVPATLPPDLTVSLFRIVQESLQNAIKYSKARTVQVHLHGGPEGLALTVADDGVGFDVDTAWGKGLGLISIVERIEAVGGTLHIRSAPGAGTFFAFNVPIPVEPAGEAAAGGQDVQRKA
jgi:signal transduction histidine kinase